MIYLARARQVLLAVALCVIVTVPASAEVTLLNDSGILEKITVDSLAMMVVRSDSNILFSNDNAQFAESSMSLNFNLYMKNNVEARFGLLYSGTHGNDSWSSSAIGLDSSNKSDWMISEAQLKFKDIFNSPVTVTVGKQLIEIEKQFLINDGDKSLDRGLWNNAERAFPFAARIDVDLDALDLTAFYAQVETNRDEMAKFLYGDDLWYGGVNAHYTISDNYYVYGGLLTAQNKDDSAYYAGAIDGPANNTFGGSTYAAYIGGDAVIGNLHLESEIVKQFGTARGEGQKSVDRDAWAGFAYATYSFAETPWKPYLRVGGWYLSGDDPDTEENENFVPFSPGFVDFGRWCPGEISGEFFLMGASNFTTLNAELSIQPQDWLQIRAQYFSNYFSEEDSYGLANDKFSDEIDLLVHFYPNDNMVLGVVGGVAKPGDGAEQLFGSDETAYTVLTHLWYFF